jgi:Protein of unknown function
MDNIFPLSDDELDALLLAQATADWQKVAMIIAKAMRNYETWNSDRVSERFVVLVDTGKLESAGNVRNWRSSEVRLPPIAC